MRLCAGVGPTMSDTVSNVILLAGPLGEQRRVLAMKSSLAGWAGKGSKSLPPAAGAW